MGVKSASLDRLVSAVEGLTQHIPADLTDWVDIEPYAVKLADALRDLDIDPAVKGQDWPSANVVVPYASGSTTVATVDNVLRAERINARLVDVGGGDDWYFELLRDLWNEGRTFVIVEQDILPWPRAIRALLNCEHPWCAYQYMIHGNFNWGPGHGCVKFGAGLMRAYPHIWDEVEDRTWPALDTTFLHLADRVMGRRAHVHEPAVIHLNSKHWANLHCDERDWAIALMAQAVEVIAEIEVDDEEVT